METKKIEVWTVFAWFANRDEPFYLSSQFVSEKDAKRFVVGMPKYLRESGKEQEAIDWSNARYTFTKVELTPPTEFADGEQMSAFEEGLDA